MPRVERRRRPPPRDARWFRSVKEEDPERFASGWVDPESREIYLITKDVIVRQLKVQSGLIADSFDRLCGEDLDAISELIAKSLSFATVGLSRAHSSEDEVAETCAVLTHNSITSTTGALALLRQGFKLQAGVLARSTVEMLAVVLHLIVRPNDITKARDGSLSSSKAVTTAKKVLPPYGQLYGLMSNFYVHVSPLHLSLQPLVEYTEVNESLTTPLGSVKMATWLTFVVSELGFFEVVPRPRYWKSLGSGAFAYAPSTEERDWMTEFFGASIADPPTT